LIDKAFGFGLEGFDNRRRPPGFFLAVVVVKSTGIVKSMKKLKINICVCLNIPKTITPIQNLNVGKNIFTLILGIIEYHFGVVWLLGV